MAQETYPTHESLGGSTSSVARTPAIMRLLWDLRGPISTAVRVLNDPTSADSPHQAYLTPTGLLMGLKGKIRAAMPVVNDELDAGPLPEDTLWLVDALVPHDIIIRDSPPSGAKVRQFRELLASRAGQIMRTPVDCWIEG